MSKGKRCLKNSPMVLTILTYCAFYSAYYATKPFSSTSIIIISAILHFFLFLSISSFLSTFLASPGEVVLNYSPESIREDQKISYTEDLSEIDYAISKITFCKICEIFRPPRSHHCRVCDKCVLRYEHHCFFVGNCIGFRTIKPFILFLIYTTISLLVLIIIFLVYVISSFSYFFFLVLVCSFAFFLFLLDFTLSQIEMAAKNVTTLELPWPHLVFNTGCYLENLKQVFGYSWLCWFLPCWIVEGGCSYPMRIRKKTSGFLLVENKFFI